jgi:hypothetical protein
MSQRCLCCKSERGREKLGTERLTDPKRVVSTILSDPLGGIDPYPSQRQRDWSLEREKEHTYNELPGGHAKQRRRLGYSSVTLERKLANRAKTRRVY